MSTPTLVIATAIIVIVSYFYSLLERRTHVPVLLMLIATGIILQYVLPQMGLSDLRGGPILEILCMVGLIIIALEASLGIDFQKEKTSIILKAFVVSLVGLFATLFGIAWSLQLFLDVSWTQALLFATPLSVISSAVVIPGVRSLPDDRREIMQYESLFSELLGIMTFYFLLIVLSEDSVGAAIGVAGLKLAITVVVAIVISSVLLLLFQHERRGVRLFVLLAVLVLLLGLEQVLSLPPLLLVIGFGLILGNHGIFLRPLSKSWVRSDQLDMLEHDFRVVTGETAFLVRTFFFIFFGLSLILANLVSTTVIMAGIITLAVIYLVRFFIMLAVFGRRMETELFLAPRGLLTLLLFYAIPPEYVVQEYSLGILLVVILVSTGIVTYAILRHVAEQRELKAESASIDGISGAAIVTSQTGRAEAIEPANQSLAPAETQESGGLPESQENAPSNTEEPANSETINSGTPKSSDDQMMKPGISDAASDKEESDTDTQDTVDDSGKPAT